MENPRDRPGLASVTQRPNPAPLRPATGISRLFLHHLKKTNTPNGGKDLCYPPAKFQLNPICRKFSASTIVPKTVNSIEFFTHRITLEFGGEIAQIVLYSLVFGLLKRIQKYPRYSGCGWANGVRGARHRNPFGKRGKLRFQGIF